MSIVPALIAIQTSTIQIATATTRRSVADATAPYAGLAGRGATPVAPPDESRRGGWRSALRTMGEIALAGLLVLFLGVSAALLVAAVAIVGANAPWWAAVPAGIAALAAWFAAMRLGVDLLYRAYR